MYITEESERVGRASADTQALRVVSRRLKLAVRGSSPGLSGHVQRGTAVPHREGGREEFDSTECSSLPAMVLLPSREWGGGGIKSI